MVARCEGRRLSCELRETARLAPHMRNKGDVRDADAFDGSDVVARLVNVNTWKRDGVRAPHKALLLLIALARLQRGKPREMAYSEIEAELKQLLRQFGPPRRSVAAMYPFWHLQTDKVWALRDPDRLGTHARNFTESTLRAHGVGGLTPEIERALRVDRSRIAAVAQGLLERNFPPSLHDSVLATVGLDLDDISSTLPEQVRETTVRRRARDPEFRRLILRIYEERCAFCGYGGRLDGESVGVEAAHIRWHAAEGPDEEGNGIAACALHHTALDRGALSFSEEHRILVSESFTSSDAAADATLRLSQAALRKPISDHRAPSRMHIAWHRREVFREPARA